MFHSHTDFTFTYTESEPVLQGLVWVLQNINGFAKPAETCTICLCSGSLWPRGDGLNSPQGWKTPNLCDVAQRTHEKESPNSSEVGDGRRFLGVPSHHAGECDRRWGCVWAASELSEDVTDGEGLPLRCKLPTILWLTGVVGSWQHILPLQLKAQTNLVKKIYHYIRYNTKAFARKLVDSDYEQWSKNE